MLTDNSKFNYKKSKKKKKDLTNPKEDKESGT